MKTPTLPESAIEADLEISKSDDQIKVGNRLAFNVGIKNKEYRIKKVDRITPTGRIVCGGYTLNPDLTVRGGSYNSPYRAEKVTLEILETVEKKRLYVRLSNLRNEDISLDQLRRIFEIINEGKQ